MRCKLCGTRDVDGFPKLRDGSKTRRFLICKSCLMKRRKKVKKEKYKLDKHCHMRWRNRLEKYGGYDLEGKVIGDWGVE